MKKILTTVFLLITAIVLVWASLPPVKKDVKLEADGNKNDGVPWELRSCDDCEAVETIDVEYTQEVEFNIECTQIVQDNAPVRDAILIMTIFDENDNIIETKETEYTENDYVKDGKRHTFTATETKLIAHNHAITFEFVLIETTPTGRIAYGSTKNLYVINELPYAPPSSTPVVQVQDIFNFTVQSHGLHILTVQDMPYLQNTQTFQKPMSPGNRYFSIGNLANGYYQYTLKNESGVIEQGIMQKTP